MIEAQEKDSIVKEIEMVKTMLLQGDSITDGSRLKGEARHPDEAGVECLSGARFNNIPFSIQNICQR